MPAFPIDPQWWTNETFDGQRLADALAQRDIALVFRFLRSRGFSRASIAGHTGLAETRVRAIANGSQIVTAYGVLERIAEGLAIPRDLMGLGKAASVDVILAAASTPPADRIAICGSRRPGTDLSVIDQAVRALSGLLLAGSIDVNHGPVGVGIEVMTYIANHYRPTHLRRAVGIFGHPNVVRNVSAVIVVGGGQGTHDEVDLVVAAGTPLIPLKASGGAAHRAHELMEQDIGLRSWMSDEDFATLATCRDADAIAKITRRLVAVCREGLHDV